VLVKVVLSNQDYEAIEYSIQDETPLQNEEWIGQASVRPQPIIYTPAKKRMRFTIGQRTYGRRFAATNCWRVIEICGLTPAATRGHGFAAEDGCREAAIARSCRWKPADRSLLLSTN